MSSGEDDSSDVAVPHDDLALSESEDPDMRNPLQTVHAPSENLLALVTGECLDPVCSILCGDAECGARRNLWTLLRPASFSPSR
jgi:hypothetical protein